MTELEYTVSFNTPAFLGNAEQQAQWRTPPFKALIRQWWRVVKGPSLGYNVAELRRAEGQVFGTASDDGPQKSLQSKLRLRLEPRAGDDKVQAWEAGKLRQWPSGEPQERHPEVGRPVGTELYLGYGPLDYDKAQRQAKFGTVRGTGVVRTAIDDKVRMNLRLRIPDALADDLEDTMRLVAWFGTLGSRSRNAWGSLHVEPTAQPNMVPRLTGETLAPYCRSLKSCLALDWPHAIGQDANGHPLIWQTPERTSWREVMKDLAQIKIAFRTEAARFPESRPGTLEDRHLMGYPVTNHEVKLPDWGRNGRLANQLRFKLLRVGGNRLQGVLLHLPCGLPPALAKGAAGRQPNGLAVWQRVHSVLDETGLPLTRLTST